MSTVHERLITLAKTRRILSHAGLVHHDMAHGALRLQIPGVIENACFGNGKFGLHRNRFDADAGSGWARGGRFGQRPLFTLYFSAGGEILEVPTIRKDTRDVEASDFVGFDA